VLERTNELAERTQQLTARSLELIKAKDQAESANAAKSMFLATMNHELRTPLSIILGFAQLMARSSDLPPKHREYLAPIQQSGEHLLGLINSVLDLAKVEAGRATLNETTVDLVGLSNDLELLFRQQAAEKGLKLRIERAATVPRYVRADAQKLRQVLINFLANAVKFTEAGSVSLRVATDSFDAAQSTRLPSTDRRLLTSDQLPALNAAFTSRTATNTEQRRRPGGCRSPGGLCVRHLRDRGHWPARSRRAGTSSSPSSRPRPGSRPARAAGTDDQPAICPADGRYPARRQPAGARCAVHGHAAPPGRGGHHGRDTRRGRRVVALRRISPFPHPVVDDEADNRQLPLTLLMPLARCVRRWLAIRRRSRRRGSRT
jgi:hypothetical protein